MACVNPIAGLDGVKAQKANRRINMCLNLSAEKINDGKGDPVEETKHKSSLTETKESPPPRRPKSPPDVFHVCLLLGHQLRR